jgi:N-acetylmuramoyl-L-alanine amidase
MTTDDIKELLTDRHAVALTIFGEARAEPLVGQVAVGCVIRNRLARPTRFGASWKLVCLRKLQFSCWWEQGGAANFAAVMAAAERLVSGFEPAPRSALAHALWVADGVMQAGTPDVTQDANHYLTAALLREKPPGWTLPPARKVADIGAHVFYKVA